ncbi:amidohydrolase family protein [Tropicimonas sp. TH_r6]|uniref:N-acetylglucosamine-6-phosphate deacetylase n=1 Tax=Tropicimonas sp. TH_r6 TaxID=3082085 RepID=UPI0029536413|nr:amidohydrolase family protein [Tropicimonas sp. TH_r6]MDV7141451.1 amidohydrolase family protein [Tropicimonas sp. TH_r6]
MLLLPEQLWSDGSLHSDMTVEVDAGKVTALRPRQPSDTGPTPHLLMPGCTDIQVNGGGGAMTNSDTTPEGFRRIAEAHAGRGSRWILPTIITDTPDVTEAAGQAVMALWPDPNILGLHIEGPHIAVERRGTHDAARIRPLDRITVDLIATLRAKNIPVLLTLAPELADPSLMAELREMGCVLSAGHTAANTVETRAALENGVTCFTHLYNAMPPMTSREPGPVGVSICSDAHVGLIADGIHVSWEMARIACLARPAPRRTYLVSDAMATVGGPDFFTLYGQKIHVQDGALVNAEGSLAGAHIDLVTSLANAHKQIGLPRAEAIAMATDVPRDVLGLPRQRIDAGTQIADLICLDETLALTEMPNG